MKLLLCGNFSPTVDLGVLLEPLHGEAEEPAQSHAAVRTEPGLVGAAVVPRAAPLGGAERRRDRAVR